jgi:hypothetical protein
MSMKEVAVVGYCRTGIIALQLSASVAAIVFRSTPAILAALALAAFTVAATVIAHSHQLVIFVEHLSIAFALAFVAWWNWRPRERRPS